MGKVSIWMGGCLGILVAVHVTTTFYQPFDTAISNLISMFNMFVQFLWPYQGHALKVCLLDDINISRERVKGISLSRKNN